MKLKAIILSFLFLLSGSGLKVEIATCCDDFSGISLNFKDNGIQQTDDCCACVKPSKKTSCCNTQTISTVINPVLGLQKVVSVPKRQLTGGYAIIGHKTAYTVYPVTAHNSIFDAFNQREYAIPILIQKRVLQI